LVIDIGIQIFPDRLDTLTATPEKYSRSTVTSAIVLFPLTSTGSKPFWLPKELNNAPAGIFTDFSCFVSALVSKNSIFR
jgi:hypothetical protein